MQTNIIWRLLLAAESGDDDAAQFNLGVSARAVWMTTATLSRATERRPASACWLPPTKASRADLSYFSHPPMGSVDWPFDLPPTLDRVGLEICASSGSRMAGIAG
jgi:hypothetical protein